MMVENITHESYLEALLRGDRGQARAVIEQTLHTGITANGVYIDVIWPIMAEIEKLLRSEKITPAQEHLATRINRTIVDQLQNKLPRKQKRDKKIAVCCAPKEIQELGAQIMTDLFESDGWEVRLLGGGLTNDDVLVFVNDYAPDILLIYGTEPKQAPDIRRLIDTIKGINAWPNMRIMVSGGLFNRAEGLWIEIGADMFAETATEALQLANGSKQIQPEHRTINTRKKRPVRVGVNVPQSMVESYK
ncbi:MAG: B12-binding domain-containing protein [Sedimentisphaerales bacterium]|nr:B12-binding domain-containing protein [Sedimentisphaerales bacterium]